MIFILFSCSDHSLNKQTSGNNGVSPTIQVDPLEIDFGLYTDETLYREFIISNIGSGTLQIDSFDIRGNQSAAFSLVNPTASLSLLSTESQTLLLQFSALANDNQAVLSISSNDMETPVIDIPIRGQANLPELGIIPNPLEFGPVGVGCSTEDLVLLTNTGTGTLSVLSITESPNEAFSFFIQDPFPLALSSSDFVSIPIFFHPQEAGFHEYELQVFSDTAQTVHTIAISGEGTILSHEEEWTIAEAPKSDIMFSVDLSSSMSDEAESLALQFQTFITELSNYTNDWQVMVVNADHGCNHSGILTPTTPNYESIFAEAVRTGAYDISFTEALLTNVTRGTEKSLPNQCNEGFMRNNAMLHIIMLSDECEQSPNPGICGTQWQSYIDRIISAKGDASLVRLSAIAGDYPSGCGNPQSAEFGSGYWESTIATGGVFLSICSDWTTPLSLQQLASTSISQTSFTLTYTPLVQTIEVLVDNIPHTDWTFDSTTNTVSLGSNVPSSGSNIKINYDYLEDCE